MAYKNLIVDTKGFICTITLNRPEKYNAFDWSMMAEFDDALDNLSRDRSVRAVILTGAGRAFCTGLDVSALAGAGGETFFVDYMVGTAVSMVPSIPKIRNLRKPVIAAVNGLAVGGGLTYALASDIRIASAEARFSSIFVKRGLVADIGTTYLLPRLVGTGQACEMILTGDMVDAEKALSIGLVNYVVKPEELMSKAQEVASKIVENPPLTVGLSKMAIYQGLVASSLEAHQDLEIYNNAMLSHTHDYKEGLEAFLQKRKPQFQGK